MAMTQATRTASRASYQRRAVAWRNAPTAEMPLFQAFLCFSHQGTTDCRCIKDGTPIDRTYGTGVLFSIIHFQYVVIWVETMEIGTLSRRPYSRDDCQNQRFTLLF